MNNRKQKSVLLQERIFVLAQMKGFAVCCGCALHTYNSATEMHGISVPASLLFAENSPPGCFRYAKTLSGSNPYLYKKTEGAKAPSVFLAQMKGFEPLKRCSPFTRFPIVLLRPARTHLHIGRFIAAPIIYYIFDD